LRQTIQRGIAIYGQQWRLQHGAARQEEERTIARKELQKKPCLLYLGELPFLVLLQEKKKSRSVGRQVQYSTKTFFA
jgi:hypothetical protein